MTRALIVFLDKLHFNFSLAGLKSEWNITSAIQEHQQSPKGLTELCKQTLSYSMSSMLFVRQTALRWKLTALSNSLLNLQYFLLILCNYHLNAFRWMFSNTSLILSGSESIKVKILSGMTLSLGVEGAQLLTGSRQKASLSRERS